MAKLNNEFSNNSNIINLIDASISLAIDFGQTTITTEHALVALLKDEQISSFLHKSGVLTEPLHDELHDYIEKLTPLLNTQLPTDKPGMLTAIITPALRDTLMEATTKAKTQGRSVELLDVLENILANQNTWGSYYLRKYGVTEELLSELRQTTGSEHTESALEEYCVNLNKKAEKKLMDPLVGRDKELFTVAHTLSKKKKCNVILVGDPGTGKTQIVEGLAQKIVAGEVPEPLKDKVIYSLEVGNILAGCRYRGEFEEKIKEVMQSLVADKNAILFIDEAHNMDAGEGHQRGGLGFSSMLKPELSRGSIKVIASTTWEGYRQTFEKDTALMRRFRVLSVAEPSSDESILILKGLRSNMEEFHGCTITDSAIQAAVELTIKYQHDRHLPDKAIDILDSACARLKVSKIDGATNTVDRESIVKEIVEITGIPVKSDHDEDRSKILNIAAELKKVVFQQDAAVDLVSENLIVSQSGLKDPNRPIGSFLFVGPSGCGKTYLAKKIADKMNMTLLKYDMSEFQEKHSLARFIGAPPGYAGYGDGGVGEGQLVNDIIRNPNSVLLFDEVEKANADIFTLFLQMLDEGKITGSTGKVADCRNCIIIMSSNLGTADSNKRTLGFGETGKTGKTASSKAVDRFFLPELRGRITNMIEFSALNEISYRRIVVERINDLAGLISNRNVKFIASENLITHILELNTASEYGARKIAGIVSSVVKYPLSVELLKGTINNNSKVMLDWADDKLIINSIPEITTVSVPLI